MRDRARERDGDRAANCGRRAKNSFEMRESDNCGRKGSEIFRNLSINKVSEDGHDRPRLLVFRMLKVLI
jgi:hypothetical protein